MHAYTLHNQTIVLIIDIDDLENDLTYSDHLVHLEMRGMTCQFTIDLALRIMIECGCQPDDFTIHRYVDKAVLDHCISYGIRVEHAKPRRASLHWVLRYYLNHLSTYNLPNFITAAVIYRTFTSFYIRGVVRHDLRHNSILRNIRRI